MYTPEQASDMLKIPPSTLRRYAAQYSAHLSEHATKQRSRRYTEQDIATLARVRELLSEGKSPEQANSLLAVMSTEQPSPDTTLTLIPSISQALTEALDTARLLRSQVSELSEHQSAQDERISDAERKLSEMASKLEQLTLEQQTPWYRKILKRSEH